MTRKIHIVFIMCCIFLASGWVSCKKDQLPSAPSSKVVGKWKKVRYATDDNANGKLDEWEIQEADPNSTSIIEFKDDKTGTEYNSLAQDLPFDWMMNGELSLMMLYHTGDTIVSKITLINAAHLNLTSKSKNGLVGYYYDTEK